MKKLFVILIVAATLSLSSCSLTQRTMKEPNVRVEMYSSDFSFSPQVSAEASVTTILGIDFERLFSAKTARLEKDAPNAIIDIYSIPVIGSTIRGRAEGYALYELMQQNPGYDVVFYPQFEKKITLPLGIPILVISRAKVTARLAKINK